MLQSGFAGWATLPTYWGPIAAGIAAALALASATWSHYFKRYDWAGWIGSVVAGIAVMVLPPIGNTLRASISAHNWPEFWADAVPLAATLVLPQLAAYPLTRRNPLRRPIVAVALVAGVVGLWVVGGLLLGAPVD